MEIYNRGDNLKINFQPKGARTKQGAGNVGAGSPAGQTEQVQPQRLLQRLQGDARVRERLLVEIEAKVQAGEFSTRAAAVEAAQRIVDA